MKKKTTMNERREARERIGIGISSLSVLISAATLGIAMGLLNNKPNTKRSNDKDNNSSKKRTVRLFRGKEVKFGGKKQFSENYPIIAIDESGKMSRPKSKNEKKYFTIVASKTKYRSKMGKISSSVTKNRGRGGEVKYIQLKPEEADDVFSEIDELDFEYDYCKISRYSPVFLSKDKSSEYYINSVRTLVKKLNNGEKIDIIIDSPPTDITNDLIDLCKELMESGINIEWFEVVPSATNNILQTQDYITGSTGDIVNETKPKGNAENILPKKRVR